MPGPVLDPARRPVVVVGVEPDAVRRARPSAAWPSRSTRCSGCGWSRARARSGTWWRSRRAGWRRRTRGAPAASSSSQSVFDVQGDLEALGLVGGRLGVRQRRVRVDVGGAAHALPVGDRAARPGCRAWYWSKRPAVPPLAWSSPVITTPPSRRAGSTRSAAAACGRRSSCRSGSRAGAAARRPAGSRPCRGRPSRAAGRPPRRRRRGRRSGSGRSAVALLAGPGRVALARVDDRAGEVVGERRRLAAVRADAAQRHRGVRRSRWSRPSRASRRSSAPLGV